MQINVNYCLEKVNICELCKRLSVVVVNVHLELLELPIEFVSGLKESLNSAVAEFRFRFVAEVSFFVAVKFVCYQDLSEDHLDERALWASNNKISLLRANIFVHGILCLLNLPSEQL